VIFNPTAKGNKARHFRRHLNEIAADCALKPTQQAGEAAHLAREAVEEGFDTIVAAGGDGTVNEVLNGLAAAPDGPARARLGVLPLGTVNVFALEHGIPFKLQAAFETIRRGTEQAVDLPWVELQSGGQTKRLCFAQMAGAGIDARAVERVDWATKKRVGRVAYALAFLQALNERRPLVECRVGGERVSGEWVLLGNGRFYAGSYAFFPKAVPGDGLLDVCVYPRLGWWTLMRFALCAAIGRVYAPPDMRHFQCEQLELHSAQRVPMELDGEAAGELPARVSIQRQRLRIIAG
jgi:diacylglycerol kinase (ATP)